MKPPDPILVVDLFPEEREALLSLLSALRYDEWNKPTVCAGWSVKDIAGHLLGDDLGRLSRGRDSFGPAAFTPNGTRDFQEEILRFINRGNETWVEAVRRLSPRLLCDLLRVTGQETYGYFQSLNLFDTGEPVSWAGPDPAPVWLDVAREYTERWHHQQQIRDAVDRPGLKEPRFFAPVLDTFVWALPHAFRRVKAPNGTHVKLVISGDAGGEWSLVREQQGWALVREAGTDLSAVVVMDQETAWRLFTKGISKDEAGVRATLSGDRTLASKVLDTVSIIA
jgi:uncharacterized protein (TIGR03083 family)